IRGLHVTGVQTCALPISSAYTISGRVLDADGNGVPGVAIGITGGATGTVTTDEDGRWSFSGARGQVTVTPAHPDYEFDPPSRTRSEERRVGKEADAGRPW